MKNKSLQSNTNHPDLNYDCPDINHILNKRKHGKIINDNSNTSNIDELDLLSANDFHLSVSSPNDSASEYDNQLYRSQKKQAKLVIQQTYFILNNETIYTSY